MLWSSAVAAAAAAAASMSGDLAAVWDVALSDGVHRIAFEHGTTTGKRVIYVDGKVHSGIFFVFENSPRGVYGTCFCQIAQGLRPVLKGRSNLTLGQWRIRLLLPWRSGVATRCADSTTGSAAHRVGGENMKAM